MSDSREQLNHARDQIRARVVGRERELTLVLAAADIVNPIRLG